LASAIGVDRIEDPSTLLRRSTVVGVTVGEVDGETLHLRPIAIAHHSSRLPSASTTVRDRRVGPEV